MIAGRFQVPRAVQATDALGAARIDAVVARRRSELTRLSLSARTATQRLDAALAALEAAPISRDGTIPSDLFAVVDAMLDKAVRASEVAIDAARGEAEFIVAAAVAERAELLRRAGVDPHGAPSAVADGARRGPDRRVVAPPDAAELWRRIPRTASTTRSTSEPSVDRPTVVDPAPPSAAAVRDARPMAHVAAVAPTSMAQAPSPLVGPDHAATAAAVATLLLDAPHGDPDRDPAATYDDFWQEVPGERRVRDRFRRRTPKEGV